MPPALSSLVAAERAFARTSVEKGIRESFLEFFADDGIGFQPHPTKVREAYLKRPAPVTRPPVTLNWQPVYADVSQAGDLGYTTGLYLFTDQSAQRKPPHYGFYFSIWKKQADGTWKVVVDCGVDTPDHSNQNFVFNAGRQTTSPGVSSEASLDNERTAIMNLDREFSRASSSGGVVNAFLAYLTDDARLHRNGILPVTGRDSARSLLSGIKQITWEPMSSDVSKSDDLGYTYGSYDLRLTGAKEEKGYYVHVWKRDGRATWKVVLDTLSPTPAENK